MFEHAYLMYQHLGVSYLDVRGMGVTVGEVFSTDSASMLPFKRVKITTLDQVVQDIVALFQEREVVFDEAKRHELRVLRDAFSAVAVSTLDLVKVMYALEEWAYLGEAHVKSRMYVYIRGVLEKVKLN